MNSDVRRPWNHIAGYFFCYYHASSILPYAFKYIYIAPFMIGMAFVTWNQYKKDEYILYAINSISSMDSEKLICFDHKLRKANEEISDNCDLIKSAKDNWAIILR